MLSQEEVVVPLDVPSESRATYLENYYRATHHTGKLMLFAGDQKLEHLNDDYYGEGITPENNDPEHMFKIASKAKIGVFATQLGLINQYGMDYPQIPYLVKLNSKTHLIKTEQADPRSRQWQSIEEVMQVKKNGNLHIVGVGYTIYYGSEYESDMFHEAAQLINQAHQHGLLSVIWAYPRGKSVRDEKDPHLVAGAAGATACLGSDFVKVNYPKKEGISSAEALKEAVQAAGRTKLVCAGGGSMDVLTFLQTLHDQIHISGAKGNATGRNIHQKPLEEAVRFCNAISAITFDDKSPQEAFALYQQQ